MDQNPSYRNPEINWIVRGFPGPVWILIRFFMFGSFIIREMKVDKYLGDMFCTEGMGGSILETTKD